MAAIIKAGRPIFMTIIIGGFLTGLGFAICGAYLVYRGSTGVTELFLFGQTFKSTNVGIAAIFVSVVMIVMLVRRTLGTVDRIVGKGDSESSHEA